MSFPIIDRAGVSLAGRPGLSAAMVGLFTLLVFFPAIDADFVNMDDPAYVYENPLVLGGLSPANVVRACTEVVFCNWAPLTILSYQLDATLFGPRPYGFHFTNVVLHAVAAALLYLALVRMTGLPGRSAAAALLFAVHPLRVESVAWIAERKDVLSVLFLMVALLAYERYCRSPSVAGYVAVAAAMVASLLAKATLVTLPVLLLLLDVWPLNRGWSGGSRPGDPAGGEPCRYPRRAWPRLIAEKLPLLAISAVFACITIATQSRAIQSDAKMPLVAARLPNAVQSIAIYCVDTVIPMNLHPMHRHPGQHGWSWGWFVVGGTSVVVLVAAGILLRRSMPAVQMGVAWFLVALAPVLGIVKQQGFQAYADRFTYVPHVGLMVAIVWACAAMVRRARLPAWVPRLALAVVIACFVAIDRRQIAVWRDSESLWKHVLAQDPASHLARCSLGVALYERGDIPAAVRELRASLALRDSEGPHAWLGLILVEQGKVVEAVAEYEAALAFDVRSGDTHHNLGVALVQLGRTAEAVGHFEKAVKIDPQDPLFTESLEKIRRITRGGSRP